MLLWTLLSACHSPSSAPGHDSGSPTTSSACPWGDPTAQPSPTDPYAAVVRLTSTLDGTLTSGDLPPTAVLANVPTTVVLRAQAPTEVITVALDGAICEVPLTLLDPEWQAPIVTGTSANNQLWCVDTPFRDGDGNQDRWSCIDGQGTVRRGFLPPDGDGLSALTILSDDAVAGIRLPGTLVVTGPDDDVALELLSTDLPTRFVHDQFDRHEVLELRDGPWAGALALLTTSYDVVGGVDVQANGIIVVDRTGTLLWDWSLHGEHGDQQTIAPEQVAYDRPLPFAYDPQDWLHANALVHGIDDDGEHFWMSLRGHDWVLRIDVATDAIPWRLGSEGDFALRDVDGEPLDDDAWFSHQHAPHWIDGDPNRVLIYDNGNRRPSTIAGGPAYSRLVELQLDPQAMTATLTWSYGSANPEDPAFFYTIAQGNAVALDASFGLLRPHAEGLTVQELGRDGEITWQATWPGLPFGYRARRLPLYGR